MKILTGIIFSTIFLNLHAQNTEEFYFNNNFVPTASGRPLLNRLSCSAGLGAFEATDITTTEGFCIRTVAYRFNDGEGLEYQNNSISDQYTINLLFKLNNLGGYARIIDFSNGNTDSGIYLLGSCLNFYPSGNIGTCPFFQPDIFYLLTLVRNGTNNEISVYINGTLFTTYKDAGNIYRPATPLTPILFFLDDNKVTCENQPGWIKYASVGRNTLNASQVDSTWRQICEIAVNECDTAMPEAQFSYQPGESEYEIVFDETSLKATYYLWDFGNGNTSTLPNPSFIFPFDGSWPVTLVAGNSCGNDTLTMDVKVFKTGAAHFGKISMLSIYQHTATSSVNLSGSLPDAQLLKVRIYSILGQMISQMQVSVGGKFDVSMPVENLAPGLYMLNVSGNSWEHSQPLLIGQ